MCFVAFLVGPCSSRARIFPRASTFRHFGPVEKEKLAGGGRAEASCHLRCQKGPPQNGVGFGGRFPCSRTKACAQSGVPLASGGETGGKAHPAARSPSWKELGFTGSPSGGRACSNVYAMSWCFDLLQLWLIPYWFERECITTGHLCSSPGTSHGGDATGHGAHV